MAAQQGHVGGCTREAQLRRWLSGHGVTGYAQQLLVMERFGYPDFVLATADDLIAKQYADRAHLRRSTTGSSRLRQRVARSSSRRGKRMSRSSRASSRFAAACRPTATVEAPRDHAAPDQSRVAPRDRFRGAGVAAQGVRGEQLTRQRCHQTSFSLHRQPGPLNCVQHALQSGLSSVRSAVLVPARYAAVTHEPRATSSEGRPSM